jgi:hypothetical protein
MKPVQVTDALQAYMEGLLPKRDKVLARIEDEAHREGIPIVDAHEGALLSLLVRLAGAKRLLELGTATGYSGIWLLRGTEGGLLTSFEVDGKRAARARANFTEAGFRDQAEVLEEDAVGGLEKLQGRFDACFIDLLTSFPPRRRVVRRAPRWRGLADDRQRAAPGRGGDTQESAGAQRCLLQPIGGQPPTVGERGGSDPRRPVGGQNSGVRPRRGSIGKLPAIP